MKKQLDIKKLLLLNMPYILMGLFATNFGEGWRMAVGADASAKMLSFFTTLPKALAKLVAQPASAGPDCGPVLWCWSAAGGLSQKQECQEVPAWHGVWLCPLECIILTVNNTFIDAGGICT